MLCIYITGSIVLDLGFFKIRGHHLDNPATALAVALGLKLWLKWKEAKVSCKRLKERLWLFLPERLILFLKEEPFSYKMVSKNPLYVVCLVFAGYVILSIFFTYPLITNFFTAIPGDGGDGLIFLWNLWWVKYALLDLKVNPFYTDYIFYPVGIGLTFHTFTFLNGLISIPFQLYLGLVAAQNIITIFSFVLSAFGAYLLINYITKNKIASFVGGMIFAFCPYKFAHLLGHQNLVTSQWIPFYILFLFRITKEGGKAKHLNGIWAGLFLLFTALSDLYYLIFLGIFTILYIGYMFFNDRKVILNPSFFKGCILLLVTFTISFLPILLFAVMDIVGGDYAKVHGQAGADRYVADLMGFITPSVLHPLFGKLSWIISKNFTGNTAEWTVFPGYTVIFFAFLAIIKFRKINEVKFWILSLLVFLILSLGPNLHIFGVEIRVPLPFYILKYIPILNNLRCPSRFNIMVMLSFAVLSAFLLGYIFCRLQKVWKISSIAIIVTTLISFEFLAIPYPMYDTNIPTPIYEKIRIDECAGAVLEIPLGWGDGFKVLGIVNSNLMYYQTIHQKQMFGGVVARYPDSRTEYYRTLPIIRTIIMLEEGELKPLIDIREEKKLARTFIKHFTVKYVIIHQPYFNTPIHKYILEVLPIEKIYEDSRVIAYKTVSGLGKE